MKQLLYQCGLIVGLALGLWVLPNAAQSAYYYRHGSGLYINVNTGPYGRYYYHHHRHHHHCFWVGGYWHHGMYYPAHRVCRW